MGSAQTRAAIIRGVYLAFGTFFSAFLSALLMDDDLRKAAIVAGVAAFAVLGFRGGVEGGYDTYRQNHGIVKDADVSKELY